MMSELSKKVPCSAPVKTKKGELLGQYSYDSGSGHKDCIVRVFDYLPGEWTQSRRTIVRKVTLAFVI